MHRVLRAALLAVTALVALSLAGTALAAYTPRLAVNQVRTATTFHTTLPQTDDPTARIAIYSPAAATVNVNQAVGSTVGQATATVLARDTGLTLPLQGNVVVDDPAKHTTDVCSPGNNALVLILNLSVAGQAIALPVYINPTSGAEAALGASKLVVCLPPPDVPAGTPGRAVLGAQLLETKFTLNNVYAAPSISQVYMWEGLFTPYTPGRGAPNPAGTKEARGFEGVPGRVTLTAKYLRKTNTYRLAGRVSEGGQGTATTVAIYRGRSAKSLKKAASTRSKSNGSFATAGHLKPRKTTYFQVRVSVPERDYTVVGCQNAQPTAAPGGCASATISQFSAVSAILRIKL